MKIQYCDGYRIITIRGTSIGEHRHIMQQHLGRMLFWYEHVHHINGIRDDNRLENLQVINTSDHTRLHHTGKVNSIDTRLKMSKPKSEETKRKISLARIGMKFSEETRRKISESRIGRKSYQKVSLEQIKEIRLLKEKGKSNFVLSRLFNLHESTISEIINKRRRYKNT